MLNKEHLARLVKRATTGVAASKREATAAADNDLARRQAATTILKPNEVSGEYDAGRLLRTTLHGRVRAITQDDIRAFQTNVRDLKKKFKGGIKAQDVIDLSLSDDREKANRQITMALPTSIRGGEVQFITNAGPDSKVSRHHVKINFLEFETAVGASPNDPKKIGRSVAGGRLQFDCDCGRHTFWYRYIATVGQYNAGRAETGFPKIRNPHLHGVACKHVLRVMHVIQRDTAVQAKLAASVLKAREVLDKRKLPTEKVRVAELREMADAQLGKRKSATVLKTSTDKKRATALRKVQADMRQRAIAAARPAATTREIERHAASLLALGAITQAQFNKITKA